MKKLELIVIPHQVAVGLTGLHLPQNPLFAGPGDARWRDEDGGLGVAVGGRARTKPADRFAVGLRVVEVTVNGPHLGGQDRVQLVEFTHQDAEFGRAIPGCGGHTFGRRCFRPVQRPSRRPAAQAFQFVHDLTAQAVEFADGEHDLTGQMGIERAELEGSAAEPAELLAEHREG